MKRLLIALVSLAFIVSAATFESIDELKDYVYSYFGEDATLIYTTTFEGIPIYQEPTYDSKSVGMLHQFGIAEAIDYTTSSDATEEWYYVRTLRGHEGWVNNVQLHPSGEGYITVLKNLDEEGWEMIEEYAMSGGYYTDL